MQLVAEFHITRLIGPWKRLPDRFKHLKQPTHVYTDHNSEYVVRDQVIAAFLIRIVFQPNRIAWGTFETIDCEYEFKWLQIDSTLIDFIIKSEAAWSTHASWGIITCRPCDIWLRQTRGAQTVCLFGTRLATDLIRIVHAFLV